MANKFEQKRLAQLLGLPTTKPPQTTKPLVPQPANPTRKAQKPCRPKAVLFQDYTYVKMTVRKGNQHSLEPFVCFKDDIVFGAPPLLKPTKIDNDIESDDDQIRCEKRKMINSLLEEVRNRTGMDVEDED